MKIRLLDALSPHQGHIIERPDILSELKRFADVHSMARVHLHPSVQPVVVVGQGLQQQGVTPILGAATIIAAAGATFPQIEIWNENTDYFLRLVALHINTLGNGDVVSIVRNVGARISGGIKGATLTDARLSLPGGRNICSLNTATPAAIFGDPKLHVRRVFTSSPTDLPPELCRAFTIAPNTGLVVQDELATTTMGIAVIVQAEPVRDTQPQGNV